MLILTRKPGESLRIGEDVQITVIEMKGNQVRIGIAAPTTMRIYREEIYLQIQEENKKAAASNHDGSVVPVAVPSAVEGLGIPRIGAVSRKSSASLGVAVRPEGDSKGLERAAEQVMGSDERTGGREE